MIQQELYWKALSSSYNLSFEFYTISAGKKREEKTETSLKKPAKNRNVHNSTPTSFIIETLYAIFRDFLNLYTSRSLSQSSQFPNSQIDIFMIEKFLIIKHKWKSIFHVKTCITSPHNGELIAFCTILPRK